MHGSRMMNAYQRNCARHQPDGIFVLHEETCGGVTFTGRQVVRPITEYLALAMKHSISHDIPGMPPGHFSCPCAIGCKRSMLY